MTASRVPSRPADLGLAPAGSTPSRQTCSVAAVRSVSASPDLREVEPPGRGRQGRSAAARAAGSADRGRRRPSASSLRPAALVIVVCRLLPVRGSRPPGRRRGSTTLSGERTSRSAAYRLRPRTRASRSAARPSSRSIFRYQWMVPSASLTRRKASSPRVGVGLVGEPAEHDRQQRALDRRAPADPGRQRLEVAHRAGRVAEAQRVEPVAWPPRGSACRRPCCSRAAAAEQRPVEEPLVHPAHLARARLPQRRRRPWPGRLRRPTARPSRRRSARWSA